MTQNSRRGAAARLAARMDQWRALIAEYVRAAEEWANGIAQLEVWVNSDESASRRDHPAEGDGPKPDLPARQYFADRRRGLAVWAHAIGNADHDGNAGVAAIVAEAADRGRVNELVAEVCGAALRICPALTDRLDEFAEELLEAAHDEAEEQHANTEGWDIDPDSGALGEPWMTDGD